MRVWLYILVILLRHVVCKWKVTPDRVAGTQGQSYSAARIVNSYTTAAFTPISEVYALKTLYDTLNGDEWLWKSTVTSKRWNFSTEISLINPCADKWQGVACHCVPPNCNIVKLELSNYGLRGELPDMRNLTKLKTIDFSDNSRLSGQLWSLSNLTILSTINLATTSIDGDLEPLSHLTMLKSINLGRTSIDGDLEPLSHFTVLNTVDLKQTLITGDMQPLSNLTMLKSINLGNTSIGGDLQPLSNLTKLDSIDLKFTSISGDFVPLSKLIMLSSINLQNTAISGDLKPLSNLTILKSINLGNTSIGGDLQPFSKLIMLTDIKMSSTSITGNLMPLSDLRLLSDLDVGDTGVTGDLWPLSNLIKLSTFFLYQTFVTGDLWPLSHLTNLTIFSVSTSAISGDLWPLSNLKLLNSIHLDSSAINGDLWPLSNLTRLNTLYLQNTAIGGDLLPLSTLIHLNNIEMYNTSITGNLSHVTSLKSLQYCLLNDNALTGSIPSLSDTSLVYFNVENNYLTGAIDVDIFPDSLQVIDVANNMLSGAIPNSLFSLPKLQIFDASINCMTLHFTQEVCNSSSLQYLILDGLNSAKSCRTKFPVLIYDTIYMTDKNAIVNVPSCIYSLGQLRYLHMSGNGITGVLPEDAILSPTFTELVLANNNLRSKIPSSFQNHDWNVLDLSFNKLTGSLSDSLNVSDIVRLKINRLSGDIPKSLYATSDVNILTGNMFACTLDQLSRLHDDVGLSYICGSSSFINASISWVSVLVVVLVLLLLIRLDRGNRSCMSSACCRYVYSLVNMIQVKMEQMASTMNVVQKAIGPAGSDTICNVSVSNIVRFTDSMKYIRHAFKVSAAAVVCVYLSLYILLSYLYGTYNHQYAWRASVGFLSGLNAGTILFVLYVVPLLALCYYNRHIIEEMLVVHRNGSKTASTRLVVAYSCVFVVNLIVTVTINGCYVFIFINYNEVIVTCTEIFVSIYKLVWTNYILVLALQVLDKEYIKSDTGSYKHFQLLSVMAIMNNLVIPCLASALVDPNCFYNVIVSPGYVTSTFTTSSTFSINSIDGVPIHNTITTTSATQYTQSFTYSYQCSSAILTSYTTVFMYSALFSALFPPFIDYLKTKKCTRAICAAKLITLDFGKTFISRFVLSLTSSAIIFVTFGVLAPILAFVMCLSISVQTLYMEYRVGIYVQSLLRAESDNASNRITVTAEDSQQHLVRLQTLDNDFKILKSLEKTLYYVIWRALLLIGPFYGFFIFDIVGDDVGYRKALWAPISFILICVLVYIIPYCLRWYVVSTYVDAQVKSYITDEIELTPTQSSTDTTINAMHTNPINSEFQ